MPISNNIVVTRPAFDLPTKYLYYWLGLIINQARQLRYNVTDLAGINATKENLYRALIGAEPLFFLGGGHGDVDVFTGNNKQVLIDQQNASWLSERLTYLFSCLTGQQLSQIVIAAGGKAFLGYNEEFGFVVTSPYIPGQDLKAEGFQEAGNAITLSLLRGFSIQDAYNSGIKTFDKWISYWYNSIDPLAPLILTWLQSDRDSLVAWGDLNAKLSEEKRTIQSIGFSQTAFSLSGIIAFALIIL